MIGKAGSVSEPGRMRRLWADESGATAIEYALIAGIMSLALVGVAGLGGALTALYEKMKELYPALGG